MSFNLIAKKIDFETGGEHIALMHEDTAINHGINAGDHIVISKSRGTEIICIVDTTNTQIRKKEIGVYAEVYEKYHIQDDDILLIDLMQKPVSIEYIKKKIKRHELSEFEINAIIKDIVNNRLGVIEKTYFLSTIYNPGYSDAELYQLTKSIAQNGEIFHFDGIVADKHSVGGIAGKGITPILVAILASFDLKVPNTSSRSITTPAGTTDILETITNVSFSKEKLQALMSHMNCFMVWGGGLNLAPADEELIRIERPVGIESFDKFIVSILAKKVAMGITHLLIDVPAGPEGKVTDPEDIAGIKDKFQRIGKLFNMEVVVSERFPIGIDGNAVGPMLEMREVLYIFEHSEKRSLQLESEAIRMAGMLLEMTGKAAVNMGGQLARNAINNGKAYMKFKQIIAAQGGDEHITADKLTPTSKSMTFKAVVEGEIKTIYNKKIIELARILGCPLDKQAGVYLYKKPGDSVISKEAMFSIYASSEDRLHMALGYIQRNNIFEIVN